MPDSLEVPGGADVIAARSIVRGAARRTPLLASNSLDCEVGATVLLKAETLQRTGSFKFRGAFYFLTRLGYRGRSRGVVAFSSGNHGQGVAAAASHFGVPATIVMPDDAPAIKVERTRRFGASVVPYDRATGDRQAIAAALAADLGAALVPPYDHPWIIVGQGSVAVEFLDQAADLGLAVDDVLVPCGGGGLTAGIALAVEKLSPGTRVHTVEPAGWDDTARSLAKGERVANDPAPLSICDALLPSIPGEMTFTINRRLVTSGVVVTDEDVREAVRYAADELKLVVEPGGSVGLAALLSGRFDAVGRTVAVVLSGGNVDLASFL